MSLKRMIPDYYQVVTDIEATFSPVSISSENDSFLQFTLASCENAPEEITTMLPVIIPTEQCESSSAIRLPLEPVTLSCENGAFDEENMFQPPLSIQYEFLQYLPSRVVLQNSTITMSRFQLISAGRLKKQLGLNHPVSFGLKKDT